MNEYYESFAELERSGSAAAPIATCGSVPHTIRFEIGKGPGDLQEISEAGLKTTWLTDALSIWICTEILPLISAFFICTTFLLTIFLIVFGTIRHYYLDHFLPSRQLTLKPLRKDKLKVVYIKYPNEVALHNRDFYKWNSPRKCYRRHSTCQLNRRHRNEHRNQPNRLQLNNLKFRQLLRNYQKEQIEKTPSQNSEIRTTKIVSTYPYSALKGQEFTAENVKNKENLTEETETTQQEEILETEKPNPVATNAGKVQQKKVRQPLYNGKQGNVTKTTRKVAGLQKNLDEISRKILRNKRKGSITKPK